MLVSVWRVLQVKSVSVKEPIMMNLSIKLPRMAKQQVTHIHGDNVILNLSHRHTMCHWNFNYCPFEATLICKEKDEVPLWGTTWTLLFSQHLFHNFQNQWWRCSQFCWWYNATERGCFVEGTPLEIVAPNKLFEPPINGISLVYCVFIAFESLFSLWFISFIESKFIFRVI